MTKSLPLEIPPSKLGRAGHRQRRRLKETHRPHSPQISPVFTCQLLEASPLPSAPYYLEEELGSSSWGDFDSHKRIQHSRKGGEETKVRLEKV